MNAQPSLFAPPSPTLQQRFDAWVKANPELVDLFLRFAREAQRSGRTKYGIAAIAERVRWEMQIERRMTEERFINNDYRSRLARLLVSMDPSLDGFFEFRKLTAR
jgi:hypothetical protein